MNSNLTLDKVLNLPNEILNNVKKYSEYSELLRKINISNCKVICGLIFIID